MRKTEFSIKEELSMSVMIQLVIQRVRLK